MSLALRLRNLTTGPRRPWVLLQASRLGKGVEKTCLLFSSLDLEDVQWHLTLPKGELGTGAPRWQTETPCKHFYLCLYEMQLTTLQSEWTKRGRWGRVWILNVRQFLVELWGKFPGQEGPPHWVPIHSLVSCLLSQLNFLSPLRWDSPPGLPPLEVVTNTCVVHANFRPAHGGQSHHSWAREEGGSYIFSTAHGCLCFRSIPRRLERWAWAPAAAWQEWVLSLLLSLLRWVSPSNTRGWGMTKAKAW